MLIGCEKIFKAWLWLSKKIDSVHWETESEWGSDFGSFGKNFLKLGIQEGHMKISPNHPKMLHQPDFVKKMENDTALNLQNILATHCSIFSKGVTSVKADRFRTKWTTWRSIHLWKIVCHQAFIADTFIPSLQNYHLLSITHSIIDAVLFFTGGKYTLQSTTKLLNWWWMPN